MTSLLARIGAWFVEPPQTPPDVQPRSTGFLPPTAAPAPSPVPSGPAGSSAPAASPSAGASSPPAAGSRFTPPSAQDAGASAPAEAVGSAAVLGAPAAVVPLAAACAGELRARAKASAALLCTWRPVAPPQRLVEAEPAAPSAESPAGATTPGARRLAARLTAHELTATACGRLAWLALEQDPAAAADQVRRCLAVAGVPVVLAVAGARPPAFEPLLAELDLAIAVLPSDIEAALRDLALVTLRARERAVLPPLPPGPPRWAAMAGLARLRSLPRAAS
jgi:hypothetical protein